MKWDLPRRAATLYNLISDFHVRRSDVLFLFTAYIRHEVFNMENWNQEDDLLE